jgi:small subunit ribosomal protein S4
LVTHKAILVNEKSNNIPSYQIQPGDKISIRGKSKSQQRIKDALTVTEQYGFPQWVEVTAKEMSGLFKSLPDRVDLGSEINEQLVVELYSK